MKKIIFPIILTILLFTSCKRYDVDMDTFIKSFQYNEITPDQFAHILYLPDTSHFLIVDVRNPRQYAISHIPGAINIPAKNFLNKKYQKLLRSTDKIILIYGETAAQTRLISALATHFNLGTIYALLGGYQCIYNHFIDHYGIFSGQYYDERPLFNYKEKFQELSSKPATLTEQKPKPIKITVPVRKKEVGGGCE